MAAMAPVGQALLRCPCSGSHGLLVLATPFTFKAVSWAATQGPELGCQKPKLKRFSYKHHNEQSGWADYKMPITPEQADALFC
eukprot:6120782-Amphidinium_carterae.1